MRNVNDIVEKIKRMIHSSKTIHHIHATCRYINLFKLQCTSTQELRCSEMLVDLEMQLQEKYNQFMEINLVD